jgi:hypothetical protein
VFNTAVLVKNLFNGNCAILYPYYVIAKINGVIFAYND